MDYIEYTDNITYIFVCMCVYIYIYGEREREGERDKGDRKEKGGDPQRQKYLGSTKVIMRP